MPRRQHVICPLECHDFSLSLHTNFSRSEIKSLSLTINERYTANHHRLPSEQDGLIELGGGPTIQEVEHP
jgi:hypothetical protein